MKDAAIQYYFPEGRIPEALAERFKKFSKANPAAGPDGMRGGMIASPRADVLVGYDDKKQRWRKMDGQWIGVSRSGADPADFVRKDVLNVAEGYLSVLGDGREWLIPVAKLGSRNYSLPVRDMIGPDGMIFQEPDERFEEISMFADVIWDSLDDDGSLDMDEDLVRSVCVSAISVFYDLTRLEIFALGLLTKAAYMNILEAIVDRHGLREMVEMEESKKKLDEESSGIIG